MKKKILIPLVFLLCGCSFSFSTSPISQFNESIDSTLEISNDDNDSTSDIVSSEISSNDDNVSSSNITSSEMSSNDDNDSTSDIVSSEISSKNDNVSSSNITSSEMSSSSGDLVTTEDLNYIDTVTFLNRLFGREDDFDFLSHLPEDYFKEMFNLTSDEIKNSFSILDNDGSITNEELNIPNVYNGKLVAFVWLMGNQNVKKINSASRVVNVENSIVEEVNCLSGNYFLSVTSESDLKLKKVVISDTTKIIKLPSNIDNTLEVNENNPYYKAINGNLYTKDGSILLKYFNKESVTEFTTPECVKIINGIAFEESNLTKIVINEGVTTIDDHAFYKCEKLISLTLPKTLNSLGKTRSYYLETGPSSCDSPIVDCDLLTELNYNGTISEWNAIEKEESQLDFGNWYDYNNIKVVHCTDGDVDI